MLPVTFQLKLLLTSPLPLVELAALQSPNRLTLKQFYFTLLFFKLVIQQSSGPVFKFYAVRPTRTLFMTTRAPYRYKLTRNQYMLWRYRYVFQLTARMSRGVHLAQALYLQQTAQGWARRLDLANVTLKTSKLSYMFKHKFCANGWA